MWSRSGHSECNTLAVSLGEDQRCSLMVGTCRVYVKPWIWSQEPWRVRKWSHLCVANWPHSRADLEKGRLQGRVLRAWAEEVTNALLWDDERPWWWRALEPGVILLPTVACPISDNSEGLVMSSRRLLAVSKCGSREDNDTVVKLHGTHLNTIISRTLRALEKDGLDSGLVADTDDTSPKEEGAGGPWVQGLP